MLKKAIIFIILLFMFILGYGYWRVSTYGWFYISLYDISDKDQKYDQIKGAKIRLLDYGGNMLASGISDSRNGVVYLSHPAAGFCVEEESLAPYSKEDRQRWYDCYEKQATWIVKWARNVRYMDLEFKKCVLKKIPVSVSESKGDWWLWWVPHPHIGGDPSTYFSLNIKVDGSNCTRVSQQL